MQLSETKAPGVRQTQKLVWEEGEIVSPANSQITTEYASPKAAYTLINTLPKYCSATAVRIIYTLLHRIHTLIQTLLKSHPSK